MIGTLTTLSLVNKDLKRSLDQVAKQSAVKRELDYYTRTIGSIRSVDDFMTDSRVYNFALKSFGLEDMAYAKGFIRKVLESDLTDLSSFANRLSDRKYRDLAAAFNFNSSKADAQTDRQEEELIGLYKQSYANEQSSAAGESSYYSAQIDRVTSVDAFLSNERLRDFALRSFGIDGTYLSRSFLRSVLLSDTDDPENFANQTGRSAFVELAAAFNFATDGSLSSSTAQSSSQKDSVLDRYNTSVPSFVTKEGAAYNKRYYEETIGTVRSIGEIASDKRLMAYLTTAYGLNANLSGTELRLILSSDVSKPNSYARIVGAEDMVRDFNFAPGGHLEDGLLVQDPSGVAKTSARYDARYDTVRKQTVEDAAANFSRRMQDVDSLRDFLLSNKGDNIRKNDKLPELYQIALRAFGIASNEVTTTELKKILTSDPYDPQSYVGKLKDDRFIALAKSFNFDAKGDASAPVTAVTEVQITRWISDYRSRTTASLKGAELEKAKREIKTEAEYFSSKMTNITTVADFTGNARLVSFVAKSAGIDPKSLTADILRKAFASDQTNAKSYINTDADPRLRSIVSAFTFDETGKITRRDASTSSDANRIKDLYLHQTLEQKQGETNDGVRLALYFQRKAPDITSIYTILGDRALFEVITTAFSLPSQISSMDVDRQAAMLSRFVKVEDLQNSAKLQSLLKRFASMFDLKNNAGMSSSAVLLGGQ